MRNHLRGSENAALTRGVLERFARFAFLCVGGVLLGGIMLGLIQVGSLDRLVTTTYGLVVLAKASLFAPMAALGAINHYKSIPLLKDPARAIEAARRIANNVRFEACLGAVVIVLAALLTSLSPAPPILAQAGPYILEQTKDGLTAAFQIYPAPRSPNQNYTLSVFLTNATDQTPYLNATAGSLRIFLQNTTPPSTAIPMDGPHGSHLVLYDSLLFPSPGTWRMDLLIQRTDGFDVRYTFYAVIGQG